MYFNQLIGAPYYIHSSVTDNGDGTYTIPSLTSFMVTRLRFDADLTHGHVYAGQFVDEDFACNVNSTGLRITPSMSTGTYWSGKGWQRKTWSGATSNQIYGFGTSSSSSTLVYPIDVHPMMVDLTLMFGAGFEPSIADFKAMFPEYHYNYNQGEWMKAPAGVVTAYTSPHFPDEE